MTFSPRKRRVLLQAMGPAQDAIGQPLAAGWSNVIAEGDGRLWADVLAVSGREYLAADASQSEVTTKIVMRYRAGVEARMRVLDGADVYDVKAVLPWRGGQFMTLMCVRGGA